MIERLWPVLAVIERCAVDLPELESLYFQRGRPSHLAQLTTYLEQRAAGGHLRTLPDAAVASPHRDRGDHLVRLAPPRGPRRSSL